MPTPTPLTSHCLVEVTQSARQRLRLGEPREEAGGELWGEEGEVGEGGSGDLLWEQGGGAGGVWPPAGEAPPGMGSWGRGRFKEVLKPL